MDGNLDGYESRIPLTASAVGIMPRLNQRNLTILAKITRHSSIKAKKIGVITKKHKAT